MPNAKFITFEGIDGCGKTTQLSLMAEWLVSRNIDVVTAREPGNTPVGDSIRRILLDSKTVGLTPTAEVLLYYASRIQNVEQVIKPALAAGKIVLCDRFNDASWAYQGFGRQLGVEFLRTLDDLVLDGFRPDHTILIEIDAATSVERARRRNTGMVSGESRSDESRSDESRSDKSCADENRADENRADENRFETEARDFFERVTAGYRWLQHREPSRFHVIEGNRSRESIHADIVTLFDSWLG